MLQQRPIDQGSANHRISENSSNMYSISEKSKGVIHYVDEAIPEEDLYHLLKEQQMSKDFSKEQMEF